MICWQCSCHRICFEECLKIPPNHSYTGWEINNILLYCHKWIRTIIHHDRPTLEERERRQGAAAADDLGHAPKKLSFTVQLISLRRVQPID